MPRLQRRSVILSSCVLSNLNSSGNDDECPITHLLPIFSYFYKTLERPCLKSHPLHILYGISYNTTMYTILRSSTFDRWLSRLRDRQAINRIVARLLAAEDGHLGDVRSVGGGVSEMRIQYGPGYRVYFITRGAELIVLLCGGDKDSQRRDIERAKRMATEWRS